MSEKENIEIEKSVDGIDPISATMIEIYDLVGICTAYYEDPTDESNQKKYEDLLSKLIVRDYLSIVEKNIALRKILYDSRLDQNSSYDFSTAIEIYSLFDGLFMYFNIDPDINIIWKTPELYDVLYDIGFVDEILQYCQKDYDKLVGMINQTISWQNVFNLTNVIHNLDFESTNKLLREFQEFSKSDNVEMLKRISSLLTQDDLVLNGVKNNIEDSALKIAQSISIDSQTDSQSTEIENK